MDGLDSRAGMLSTEGHPFCFEDSRKPTNYGLLPALLPSMQITAGLVIVEAAAVVVVSLVVVVVLMVVVAAAVETAAVVNVVEVE